MWSSSCGGNGIQLSAVESGLTQREGWACRPSGRGRRLTAHDDTSRNWVAVSRPEWRVRVVNPDAAPVPEPAALDGLDDAALVHACRQGRREAFDVLVSRHQRNIYKVCFRFAGNHADASDLTQEAFLRAWRGLAGFKGRSSVSTWLYRIAVNASLNRVSARSRPAELVDEQLLVDDTGDLPSDDVFRRERATAVRRAVLALPDRQRATVILRIYHDLAHHEIADILGSSVGSVKANLFHALRNLRRLLGDVRP
jgi:RNA polymerase sigma-70 factor, ECF subfamily